MTAAGAGAAASPFSIRLFGPLEVCLNGSPLPRLRFRKSQWLLALLALRHGAAVEQEWLIGLLWPESAGSQALRNCLTDLRHALGDQASRLHSPTPYTLSLDLAGATADVVAFDAAIARGDPGSLEEAVALCRGPLLEGCSEEWAFQERQDREQAYLAARERLAALAVERGEAPEAERHLRLAVAVDPLRESTQRALMQVLAARGNYAAALLCYRELRLHLLRELNTEPDPETKALFQQLRSEGRRLSDRGSGIRRVPAERVMGSVAGHGLAAAAADRELTASEPLPDALPPGTPDAAAHPLPLPLTRFIGREREMAEVKRLLGRALGCQPSAVSGRAGGCQPPAVSEGGFALTGSRQPRAEGPATESRRLTAEGPRLLTLTGAGGCGKTRLALQVAAELLGDYPDGVRLVELAPLADHRLVPQAVASALAVRETPGRSLTETLVDALRSRSLLIVLDNCEHLLGACAELAEALLRACPKLRILATSREGLNISGETAYRLPSLRVPAEARLPLEALGQVEAVQLFLDRAQAATPSFTLTESNAPAVAAICRRLDGIPLAIELAAARVKALPVETINARLDDRFRLLTGGSRTALRRHQTLRALIDWSYDLLSEPERVLLRRLSVFSGGWTLEAAEAVCGGAIGCRLSAIGEHGPILTDGRQPTADGPLDVLDLMSRLVEKSLVLFDEQGPEARYRLLETVRQYARDRLLESGEAECVRRRHRDWCLAFAERAEPELRGPEQRVWLHRLEIEHDNLRAALEWGQSEGGTGDTGLRLAGALGWFWGKHDYRSEGRAWLERTLARTEGLGRTAARAKALYSAGNLAWTQGDWVAARPRLEESVAIWRELGNRDGVAHSLRSLAIVVHWLGDPAAAHSLAEESVALFRQGEDRWGLALSLHILAARKSRADDYEGVRSLLEESLTLFRETGDRWGISCSLNGLGYLAYRQGDYAAARLFYEECLDRPSYVATKWGTAGMLINLGNVTRCEGDYGRAAVLYKESLALNRDLTSKDLIAQALHNLGYVAQHEGDDRRAARLFGAADALIDATSRWLDPNERAEYERHSASARAALGEEAFAAAWAEGRAMPLERAVCVALEEKEIPPAAPVLPDRCTPLRVAE